MQQTILTQCIPFAGQLAHHDVEVVLMPLVVQAGNAIRLPQHPAQHVHARARKHNEGLPLSKGGQGHAKTASRMCTDGAPALVAASVDQLILLPRDATTLTGKRSIRRGGHCCSPCWTDAQT